MGARSCPAWRAAKSGSNLPKIDVCISIEDGAQGGKDVDAVISAIPRHVAFFIYPQFNLIDLSGPVAAFATATDIAPGSYRCTVMSLAGG